MRRSPSVRRPRGRLTEAASGAKTVEDPKERPEVLEVASEVGVGDCLLPSLPAFSPFPRRRTKKTGWVHDGEKPGTSPKMADGAIGW
ncbi:hypothetical protein NDU88_002280 [Pleurodeles waltl]|uniref:Uncharacterized protein n=1 Tax=Pleurodeles waltl TaxID=8319 RepID=A0AAV7SBG0_PLEWA|nr:hypothetical protein NDU88_002280 [Pleurodeles waltl]